MHHGTRHPPIAEAVQEVGECRCGNGPGPIGHRLLEFSSGLFKPPHIAVFVSVARIVGGSGLEPELGSVASDGLCCPRSMFPLTGRAVMWRDRVDGGFGDGVHVQVEYVRCSAGRG